jgi:transposase
VHRDWLLALRREENDLTLEAIGERLQAEKGVTADGSMLSRFFKAEGISFKKNRARKRAGAAGRGRGAHRVASHAA